MPQGVGLQGSICSADGGNRWQAVKGSPVCPSSQEHIGLCSRTAHTALLPHEPGQGSLHLLLMQALFEGQSLLTVHSRRQAGGVPSKLGKQVQM